MTVDMTCIKITGPSAWKFVQNLSAVFVKLGVPTQFLGCLIYIPLCFLIVVISQRFSDVNVCQYCDAGSQYWTIYWSLVNCCTYKCCNYANQSVQRGLWDVVLNAMNLCEPQRKLRDTKTLRFTNDLWRKTFRQAYQHRSFAEPSKHLLCTLCPSSNNARFE